MRAVAGASVEEMELDGLPYLQPAAKLLDQLTDVDSLLQTLLHQKQTGDRGCDQQPKPSRVQEMEAELDGVQQRVTCAMTEWNERPRSPRQRKALRQLTAIQKVLNQNFCSLLEVEALLIQLEEKLQTREERLKANARFWRYLLTGGIVVAVGLLLWFFALV